MPFGWVRGLPVAVLLVAASGAPVSASRVASSDAALAFDPDALMQPSFHAPLPAPAPTRSELDQKLRDEDAELRVLELEASNARARYERQAARLRRAAAERLRQRGVSVDWHAYDLATLHGWERRLAGDASSGALALGDDDLLPPGSVKMPRHRLHAAADADGVLAPGSVARAWPVVWRGHDPDALLPLGYAARRSTSRAPLPPVDADAPLRY